MGDFCLADKLTMVSYGCELLLDLVGILLLFISMWLKFIRSGSGPNLSLNRLELLVIDFGYTGNMQ